MPIINLNVSGLFSKVTPSLLPKSWTFNSKTVFQLSRSAAFCDPYAVITATVIGTLCSLQISRLKIKTINSYLFRRRNNLFFILLNVSLYYSPRSQKLIATTAGFGLLPIYATNCDIEVLTLGLILNEIIVRFHWQSVGLAGRKSSF